MDRHDNHLWVILVILMSIGSHSLDARQRLPEKGGADVVDAQGAIVKHRVGSRAIHLIFSADVAFEGADTILNTLAKHRIYASFFLTGNCLRNEKHKPVIHRIIKDGHYVGGHSDKHILYASWEDRQQTLVAPDSLIADFERNMEALGDYGIKLSETLYFLSPYEWYNQETVSLIERCGQKVINMTPGIRTAADYTTPAMKNYASSQQLKDQLYDFEKENGLDGAIILIHPGTSPQRTDKLYFHLDEMIEYLKKKGYHFERF